MYVDAPSCISENLLQAGVAMTVGTTAGYLHHILDQTLPVACFVELKLENQNLHRRHQLQTHATALE